MQTPLYRSEMLSPFGPLTLLASAKGLAGVLFRPPPKSERVGRAYASDLLADTRAQLTEYFSGRRHRFALPLDLHGTAFQLRVWQTLCDIPYGESSFRVHVSMSRQSSGSESRRVESKKFAPSQRIWRACVLDQS